MTETDLIAYLAGIPARLKATIARMPPEHLRKARGDNWSPCQVLGHLRHSMEIFEGRIERILVEDRPTVRRWDQDEDTINGDYNSVEPGRLLEDIARSRDHTVTLLRGMDAAQWQRSGLHEDPEIGEFTLLWMGEHIREHEQEHLADLEAAATT